MELRDERSSGVWLGCAGTPTFDTDVGPVYGLLPIRSHSNDVLQNGSLSISFESLVVRFGGALTGMKR